jgi:hypothetical protein
MITFAVSLSYMLTSLVINNPLLCCEIHSDCPISHAIASPCELNQPKLQTHGALVYFSLTLKWQAHVHAIVSQDINLLLIHQLDLGKVIYVA